MKRVLLPVILALVGLLGGLAGGYFLRPADTLHPEAVSDAQAETTHEAVPQHPDDDHAIGPEYLKLSSQFIVPIVEDGRITSVVVLFLSLEITAGTQETVYAREPKLRDSFLQILFDHANSGGFRGTFTEGTTLAPLRRALLEAAQSILPGTVTDVLITDITRQDA